MPYPSIQSVLKDWPRGPMRAEDWLKTLRRLGVALEPHRAELGRMAREQTPEYRRAAVMLEKLRRWAGQPEPATLLEAAKGIRYRTTRRLRHPLTGRQVKTTSVGITHLPADMRRFPNVASVVRAGETDEYRRAARDFLDWRKMRADAGGKPQIDGREGSASPNTSRKLKPRRGRRLASDPKADRRCYETLKRLGTQQAAARELGMSELDFHRAKERHRGRLRQLNKPR